MNGSSIFSVACEFIVQGEPYLIRIKRLLPRLSCTQIRNLLAIGSVLGRWSAPHGTTDDHRDCSSDRRGSRFKIFETAIRIAGITIGTMTTGIISNMVIDMDNAVTGVMSSSGSVR
ncbi:MAG: hypothetical protein JOY96_07010 [Verrucomicrobia bacterium]|nr:hypothetical protein [Verrucomicrobiota bacterium]MBV9671649.1 hypothetical protein [Verrucomicrobiota bacterium]